MKRHISVGVAVLLVVLLSGCAAGGLFGLLKLIEVGRLAGKLLSGDDDPTEYRVYVDGYDIGRSPGPNGDIDLNGLPQGVHLMSITTADKRRGWHQLLAVDPDQTANIGEINPFEGATIAGTVSREITGGSPSLMPGVLVIAVKGAGNLLQAGGGSPIYLPPDSAASTLTYLAGYTNEQGRYTLGPAEYGDYIVVTAAAGYFSDAAFVQVGAGQDAAAVDLLLEDDASQNPGRVSGVVSVASGGPVLLTAALPRPYQTPISSALRQQIEQQSGLQLTSQPWFYFPTLTILSDSLGRYELDLPAGRHNLQAFVFGFEVKEIAVDVVAGGLTAQDFTLAAR